MYSVLQLHVIPVKISSTGGELNWFKFFYTT